MRPTLLVSVLASVFGFAAFASCSVPKVPAQPPAARGPHANEQLAAAREHTRRAEALARWPEARRGDPDRFDDAGTGLWYRSWETANDPYRAAPVHASEAGRKGTYDEACIGVPPAHQTSSPLQRHGLDSTPTANGVIVFLRPDAGAPDRLLAEIRCHRAWMMLAVTGEDVCPLDIANVHIQAHGDKAGISIEISVADPLLVREVQLSAAHDLEVAANRLHATNK